MNPIYLVPSSPWHLQAALVVLAPLGWAIFLRGYSKRAPIKTPALSVATGLGLSATLALSGWTAHWERLPPPMLVLLLAAILALVSFIFFLPSSQVFSRLPQTLLIGIQAVRLPLELIMGSMATYGLLPIELTFHGKNFDIITGLIALPVAYTVFRRGEDRSRNLILVFNGLGIVLAAWVIGHALLSTPTSFQQLKLSIDNRWIAYFPWVWLPLGVVPLAFLGHAASLRKWWLSRG